MRVKCAFDPNQLLNPGKVFPQLHRCAELGRCMCIAGKLPFPGHAALLWAAAEQNATRGRGPWLQAWYRPAGAGRA
jgi:hypothetical protein